MNWKQYEKEIHELFLEDFPEADIKHDVKVDGRYSKTKRQVDILIEDYVAGNRIRIVVDAKFFSKRVDVKAVESFIGMLSDIEAHKGLLITQKGYSDAALKRAFNDPGDIELDILNFDELKTYQGFGAIPYAGDNGVLLPAPFGWIVDNRTSAAWVALLYQRGLDLEKAQSKGEWMYINFWNRNDQGHNLEDLLKIQEENMKDIDPELKLTYRDSVRRSDARTKIRMVEIKNYPTPEITGFVEFDEFIFFCVLFSPPELSNKNIRKLENILKRIRPIKVKQSEKNKS